MHERDDRVLIRVTDAARCLSCSERMVWRLIADGDLRAVKVGRCTRIPRKELDRLASIAQPEGSDAR